MFTHYLKAALRSLRRSKLDGLINIAGLALGLAAAILILLFVRDESSYDAFWPDVERVYRLEAEFTLEGRPPLNTILAMGPARAAFARYFSADVETVARMNRRTPVITRGAEVFTDHVILADPEILDIFPLEAAAGDPRAALADLRSIIVTESFARKYFGDAEPMGQTITLTQSGAADDYTVAAVVQDLPENTHIELNAMIPVDEVRFQVTPWLFDSWFSVNNHTYVKLRPGVNIADVRARLDDFTNAEVPADEGQASDFVAFRLRPVKDIHLNATGVGEMKPRGDAKIVLAFTAIAFLIVAVAAVNFVNLATARAGLRAREVALRKVVGAGRGELIRQHLAESLFVTGVATALALGIVELALPAANGLLGKSLASPFAAPGDMGLIALAWLIVAFSSGLYPATLISGFRPGPQLHGTEAKASGHAGWGRNLMVAFQSAVTIALVAATGVVAAQLNLFRSLDRGFDEEQLIALPGTYREGVGDSREALKAEIENLPMVTATAYVSETPGSSNEVTTTVRRPGEGKQLNLGELQADQDFLKTFGIEVLAGRDLDRTHAMDRDPLIEGAVAGGRYPANILINRLAARTLGFATPEDAIGRHIVATVLNTEDGEIEGDLTIVGVIGNVYLHTVKRELSPMIYRVGERRNGLMVRYRGDSKAAVAALEGVWKSIAPTVPFATQFVDQSLAAELDGERVQMKLFFAFAALTVIIAALGLYGLAAFSAERRTREIGIRRVLGARVADVFRLMLWQFSKPVIGAILVASPVAAYLMLGWLEKFPYRIAAPEVAGYVLLAGVAALLIAWATVFGLTFRVARAHPVHALKHE